MLPSSPTWFPEVNEPQTSMTPPDLAFLLGAGHQSVCPPLTLTCLFSCLPPLPHSPPASCPPLLLPSLPRLRPTILTSLASSPLPLLSPYFCPPPIDIALDYYFSPPFAFSPPVLSPSHSSLSPADSAWISVLRRHMTISPIGSPPPPMSSYRLAPFPAKSRGALRRPPGRPLRHAAPLLLHAGLDPLLTPGEPIGTLRGLPV